MRIALVTTAPSRRSGIGDYTKSLARELATRCELSVFVPPDGAGEDCVGLRTRSIEELARERFDHLLFQIGNEIAHAPMRAWVRRLGGTVVLHDWILFDNALAAFPEIARGGLAGHWRVWREGGAQELAIYRQNRVRTRSERRDALAGADGGAVLLGGWHGPEPEGRWTSDEAGLAVPSKRVQRLALVVHGPGGRTLRLLLGGRALAAHRFEAARPEVRLELDLDGSGPLLLAACPITPTAEQRANGDPRRLGVFVRAIEFDEGHGWRALDLARAPERRVKPFDLSHDRFRLAQNRRIVHAADSFLVHSRHVAGRIAAARGERTPVGVVWHGAAPAWRDEARRTERVALGLAPPFVVSFLLTSFGHVQAHKRIDPLLAALARARRERPDLRLVLAGVLEPFEYDAQAKVRELGLADAVHLTGWVDEEEARRWIHAGDLAVQLRGPSTGGTSGGVFQSLALGRGVIATDLDEQSELPDACVLKVASDEREVESLARLFVSLHDEPARRFALEAAARSFVEAECAWSRVAERYLEHLARFPRPRAWR